MDQAKYELIELLPSIDSEGSEIIFSEEMELLRDNDLIMVDAELSPGDRAILTKPKKVDEVEDLDIFALDMIPIEEASEIISRIIEVEKNNG